VKLGLWILAYCLNANISLISALQCQHWPLILWPLYLYEVLQTELAELWAHHFIFIACSFIWWIISMIICNPLFVCIINLGLTYRSFLLLSSHPAFAFFSSPSSSILSSIIVILLRLLFDLSFLFCPLWNRPGVATEFRTVALNIFRPVILLAPKNVELAHKFLGNLCTPVISLF